MNGKIISAALALAATGAFATPEGWTDDFDAAKEQAAKEGKLMLVDFSGSDWCGWCKKLDKEVFAQPEFVEGAKKDFVLVLIDSPRDKSILSDKAKEQNPKLVEKYDIQGFPTVLVMDADGAKVGQSGYRPGGPEAYLKELAGLKAAAQGFVEFKKSVAALEKGGAERLAKIDAFLEKIGTEAAEDHEDLVDELLANDKDGKYAAKYPHFAYYKKAEAKLMEFVNMLNKEGRNRIEAQGGKAGKEEFDKVKKEVDAIAKEKLPEVKKAVGEIVASAPESAKDELKKVTDMIERLEKSLDEKPKAGRRRGRGKKGGKPAKKEVSE